MTKTDELAVPTIHLNGTSRAEIMNNLLAAIRAVVDAGEALGHACPNGRDYYPQGNGAINRAMEQHRARMKKLHEVATELRAIAEAIP